jgi:arylsulfatase A-like enzyme
MKRWAWVIGVIAVLVGGGFLLLRAYGHYLPGVIGNISDPIAPHHAVTWAQGPTTAPEGERRPNIIVIVADDLGFNDISRNGGVAGGLVRTPNIDALATEGVSVDIAYAANATCSPSRAAIMTGRYPTRFGFEFTGVPVAFSRYLSHSEPHALHQPIFHSDRVRDMPPLEELGMPASEVTIAEVLRGQGYHTLHIGKWHLGETPEMRPEAQGFDESLGFMAGAGMFMPPNDPNVVNAKLPFDPIDRFIWANLPYAVQWNGGQRFRPEGYVTDYFANEAVAAVEANRNRPFFMYLAFNAPHTPLQASRADYDALSGIPDHTERVYGAMITALDRGVGHVMQALRDNGLDDNTLVIFTSDNGGAWYVGQPRINAPFEGDLLRRRHPHAFLRALAGASARRRPHPRPRDAHGHLHHRRGRRRRARASASRRRRSAPVSQCASADRGAAQRAILALRAVPRRAPGRLEAASLGKPEPRMALQSRQRSNRAARSLGAGA